MAPGPKGGGTSDRQRNPKPTSPGRDQWLRHSIAWSRFQGASWIQSSTRICWEACPLLLSATRCGLDCYGHLIDKIVGRIGNHCVRLGDAAEDFDSVSEIAAQRDLSEFDAILAVHHAHLRTLRLEQNGVSWEHERHGWQGKMKVDLGIGAGKQFPFRVGHIHFGKQRPRVHADGVVGSRDGAGKQVVGNRSNLHRGADAWSNGLAVHFRYIYKDPHRGDVGDAEKLCTQTTVAGVDEVTHFCFSSGYHPVEGGVDLLESLHLLEPAHFGGGGLHVCGLRVEVLVVVVDFLLGNRIGFDQVAVAWRGHRGGLEIRLRLGQHRASVAQLLIDLRRFDYREELPFAYVGSDISIPNAEVAVDAGVDGRFRKSLNGAGNRQVGNRAAAFRMNDVDVLQGKGLGGCVQAQVAHAACIDGDQGGKHQQSGDHQKPQQPFSLRTGSLLLLVCARRSLVYRHGSFELFCHRVLTNSLEPSLEIFSDRAPWRKRLEQRRELRWWQAAPRQLRRGRGGHSVRLPRRARGPWASCR